MEEKKKVFQQTGQIALGVLVCTAAMLLVYYLLGRLDMAVLCGALVGFGLSILNFLAMALTANRAADKAQQQDVKAGTLLMQSSYIARLAILFILLVILAKTKLFNPLAMVIPLVFVRPVITVIELLLKKSSKEENAQ